MSLAQTLLNRYADQISSLTLIPSDGGAFEVLANGELIYSKLQTHRHTTTEEIIEILQQKQLLRG